MEILKIHAVRGRQALETTSTTIDLVQARLTRIQSKQQRRFELWLALLGVAFAVPQVIDREIIEIFLTLNFSSPDFENFIFQVAIMVGAAIIVGFIYRLNNRH